MSKENILKTATNLFSHYGIKGVSMSQIAGALHISKKTLYEVFGSKEILLASCIKNEKKRLIKILDNTGKNAPNPLEALLLSVMDLYHYKLNFCPSFKKDIKRYPELYGLIITNSEVVRRRYMSYFNQGIEQGIFLPQFEYERIAELIVEQVGNEENIIQQPYIMMTFLREVCTQKGIEILNSFNPVNIRRYS